MGRSTLDVQRASSGVASVVIDAPPINVMTVGLFFELADTVDRLAADDDVRAVVFRSANPDWFIAHFDVEAILTFPTEAPPASELNRFHSMCETLRTMPKVTIAAIDGRVGGGGSEFASSCDMRFATPRSIFNQPEVALGIIPGGSGTVRLPALLGRARALEVMLGCNDIDAATAERWGWVNRLVAPEDLVDHVEQLAARVASFSAAAVGAVKDSVNRVDADVHGRLLAEGDSFNALLADPTSRRAMQRFLDIGGQTPEGEARLGDLAAELSADPA